jgi:hypothetical protein
MSVFERHCLLDSTDAAVALIFEVRRRTIAYRTLLCCYAIVTTAQLLQDNESALHAACAQVAASFETMAATASAGQQPLLQRAALHPLSILHQVIAACQHCYL